MKQHHPCPKCHSTDIITNVRPLDFRHGNAQRTAELATYREPGAFLFKGKQSTTMSVWVCAQCGFVEFYADDPQTLRIEGH